ncbi:hypothetical protein Ac2012v2_005743 [Leucoagaricus gongylophorus]
MMRNIGLSFYSYSTTTSFVAPMILLSLHMQGRKEETQGQQSILLRLNMLKGVFKSPELSVIFFPLTHGIIRWLDDNHVIDLRRGSGSEYSQRRKKNRQHD